MTTHDCVALPSSAPLEEATSGMMSRPEAMPADVDAHCRRHFEVLHALILLTGVATLTAVLSVWVTVAASQP